MSLSVENFSSQILLTVSALNFLMVTILLDMLDVEFVEVACFAVDAFNLECGQHVDKKMIRWLIWVRKLLSALWTIDASFSRNTQAYFAEM